MTRLKNLLAVMATLFAVAVVGLALLMWNFERPPIGLTKLDRLTVGMSKDEVRREFGSPSSTSADAWTYTRVLAWPILHVYFDESERYVRHEYDR